MRQCLSPLMTYCEQKRAMRGVLAVARVADARSARPTCSLTATSRVAQVEYQLPRKLLAPRTQRNSLGAMALRGHRRLRPSTCGANGWMMRYSVACAIR